MPRATNNDGSLANINYISQGGGQAMLITPCGNICFKILPDFTDSKGANYTSEPTTGRTTPLLSYAYSEPRMISTDLHFMVTKFEDIQDNLRSLRILQSLVYPGPSSAAAPYTPPPAVRLILGTLFDGPGGVCVVLRSQSFRGDPNVAWDVVTLLPYRFTVSCSWEVVYACRNLPTNKCIAEDSNVFFTNEPPEALQRNGFFYSKTVGNG